jgi:hypothetical protein
MRNVAGFPHTLAQNCYDHNHGNIEKWRTPFTVAANQEPSGCGTTLSIAEEDVMAVLSATDDGVNKGAVRDANALQTPNSTRPVGSTYDAGPLRFQPGVLQGRKSWKPSSQGATKM